MAGSVAFNELAGNAPQEGGDCGALHSTKYRAARQHGEVMIDL
jgi:hypothetical protein